MTSRERNRARRPASVRFHPDPPGPKNYSRPRGSRKSTPSTRRASSTPPAPRIPPVAALRPRARQEKPPRRFASARRPAGQAERNPRRAVRHPLCERPWDKGQGRRPRPSRAGRPAPPQNGYPNWARGRATPRRLPGDRGAAPYPCLTAVHPIARWRSCPRSRYPCPRNPSRLRPVGGRHRCRVLGPWPYRARSALPVALALSPNRLPAYGYSLCLAGAPTRPAGHEVPYPPAGPCPRHPGFSPGSRGPASVWAWAAGRDGIPGLGPQAFQGAALRGSRRASGDPVDALAGAPAARARACGAKRFVCPAVWRAFPGRPERRALWAAGARAVIRASYVRPPCARVSTALRVTEGRLWAHSPVRVRPVSGGQVVQRAATRDQRRRARPGDGRMASSVRRSLRSLADRPLGGRAIGGIWNPRGLLRQGCLLGAQQQAQRDQNTGRSKNPPVSHGNTLHAASTVSGMKKPVVILHNPQRRHTLQGPPDHQTCSWWSSRPPLPIITGPPKSFIDSFRARCPLILPDTSISSQIRVRISPGRGRPGFRPGSRVPKRCICVVRLLSRQPLFSGGPTRHAGIVA